MKLIPKYQTGQKFNWTRVKFPSGKYGYVKTDKNDLAVEYKRDGTFKVYSEPNEKSRSFYTSFETRPRTIQRVPDDHDAHLILQKKVDDYVNQVTPSAGDFFQIGTLGGLNNLSPTQWRRRLYDLGEVAQGKMSGSDYMNHWFYGNNGIASDEYARKHPYRAIAANLAGDVATFGAASTLRRMPGWYRTMLVENQMAREAVANNWRNIGKDVKVINTERPSTRIINRKPYNYIWGKNKKDLYEIYPKIKTPFAYDAFGEFIPNKNYYYRRGWGIIDDAVNTGRIRVPEGDYKSIALKKYPLLDNGNPFSTALMNHEFPYFSEGKLWDAMTKFGEEPEDLIAISREVPEVDWVAGSKWGKLLKDKKPSEVGGRATPLINGETNKFPTSKASLFKYNKVTRQYEPLIHPSEAVNPAVRGTRQYVRPVTNSNRYEFNIMSDNKSGSQVTKTSRPITVNGSVAESQLPSELSLRGWITKKPITINGKETLLVQHPDYGFTTLEEATGDVGRGKYALLVTNEGLDTYNPEIRLNPENGKIIDLLRSIARKIDVKKESPAIITNTEDYEYPHIWDLLLKTLIGKTEYPNGATMVSRGLWPGSPTIAKSPNYDALFTGYNRDMSMPYIRIGTALEGKNNFTFPKYEKYFSKEEVEQLRELDKQIKELTITKGYYNKEDASKLQHLHNLRSTLLRDKMPEFRGLQLLLVPNASNGEMLNTVLPTGLAMEGGTFGDLGAGQPITISRLAGDLLFYDANSVSGALASEGPARNIFGVFLHSLHPSYTGIHDKGIGSTLIWNQDGFAPFLKSVHGSSLKNLSGTIESAYKKGGKILKNIN